MVALLATGPAVMAAVPRPPTAPVTRIPALFETDPVTGTGDAADDMAIWVDLADRSQSLVIGTDKKADALEVYDLHGHRLQRIADGNGSVNNVDLRYGFPLDGQPVDIVVSAGSDLAIYNIDPVARQLVDVTARLIQPVNRDDYAGTCLYHDPWTNRFFAFTTAGNGNVEEFELFDDGTGRVDARPVRGPWDVDPANPKVQDGEIEACVADDQTGDFYVAEQDVGVWRYSAAPDAVTTPDSRAMVLSTYLVNGGYLVPDIEGLTIVHDEYSSYLLASSQGDSTFGLYYLDDMMVPYPLMMKFRITGGPMADGCSITDGIDAVPWYLGPDFPHGLFVCQDNTNSAPGTAGTQDFKFVPLERIIPWANPDGL